MNAGIIEDIDGGNGHCGRPIQWDLHEHGDPLLDPCWAWSCTKCGYVSEYDCEEN